MQSQVASNDKSEKTIRYLSTVVASSVVIFLFSIFINRFVEIKISQDSYLMFHVFTEIASALISFSIFVVLFFTYDIFYRKYSLILANTFFITGLLDIFHMLTYNGMYSLFPENIQTPTYFWIFSRFILGIGLFIAYTTKKDSLSSVKKGYSIILGILVVGVVFLLSIIYVEQMPPLIIKGKGLTNTKIIWEYVITTIFIIDIFAYVNRSEGKYTTANVYMLSGLMLGLFAEVCFMLYVNVYDTLNITGHIFKILSYGYIFRAVFVKNVRRPYQQIFEQKEMLTLDINDMTIAMEEQTAKIYKQNKELEFINTKIKDDLASTREIQKAMFPKKDLVINDLRFNFEIFPCEELSGDYVNYFSIDDENIGFYIMDVSGHGVAAAMLGVFAAQSIGESMRIKYKEASIFSPAAVLNHFYSLFNKSNFPDEIHIVMLYGMYNKNDNKVILSSAGLNCNPILISQDAKPRFLEIESGFPICKLGDVFEPNFEDYEIELKYGEKLLLHTDGLTEMRRQDGDFWGADSLLAYIDSIGVSPSFILNNKLKSQIVQNITNSGQDDDITYCVIEKISP